jgi:hypothetical protein
MSQAGAARARSIESIGDSLASGIKQYQQNQSFTAQSLAKFTERMQDPEFYKYVNSILSDESNKMGVPESVKTAFRNAQTGKLKPNEASTLATIAQDYSERKKASEESEFRKTQTALAFAQAANQTAAADETNLKLQRMRSAQAELAQFGNGNLSTAPVRPIVPQGISQFGNVESLALPQTSFDPRSNPIIAASVAQQQPAGRPISAIDSDQLNRQARMAQLEYQSSTGLFKPLNEFTTGILAVNKEARAAESANRADARAQQVSAAEMTLPEAMAKIEILKKQYPDSNFTAQPGTNAASYVIKQEVKPDPNIDLRKIQYETRIKPVQIYLDNISKNADLARNDLPRLDRLDKALESGVTTGPGSEISTYAKSLFSDTGLVNNKDLAKNQVFQADLAMDRLLLTRVLLDGQGSVQVEERRRVDSAAANVTNDPRAIKELMKMHRAATNRSIAAEDHRIMLDEKSDFNNPESLMKIDRDMKKWFQQNPLSKFGFPERSQLSSANAKSEPAMFADEIKEKLRRNAK